MTMPAVRRAVLAFAMTARRTLAEPWPEVGLRVIQEASDEALHWQSRAASTLIVALPPLKENVREPLFTLGAQRTDDGPTTSVSVVVPPQPYTAVRTATTTSARFGTFLNDMTGDLPAAPLMHFFFQILAMAARDREKNFCRASGGGGKRASRTAQTENGHFA
jgi:hypothetical protein